MSKEQEKYLYCIIGTPEKRNPEPIKIEDREIRFLQYRDIAAAVSVSPCDNFDNLPKEELTNYVAMHGKVNEWLLKEHDVVPMCFGTIAKDEADILKLMEKAYVQILVALKIVSHKVEFVVQAFFDEKRAIAELLQESPEIQELKGQAETQSGIFALPLKIRLGKLIYERLEAWRQELRTSIVDALKEYAVDVKEGKRQSQDLLMNDSFLIERILEPKFDSKMNELEEKYGEFLKFKYIGPMPPYSFVNINLSLGNFEVIDQARKVLVLGEEATLEEIKKAYRALSQQYHPDTVHYKGDEKLTLEMTGKMRKVAKAYQLLTTYCQCSCVARPGEQERVTYSFKKYDVENAIIIRNY